MPDSIGMKTAQLESGVRHRVLSGARLTGIALICTATVLFSFLDTNAKYLVTIAHLPLLQIIWVRFLVNAVFIIAVVGPAKATNSLRSRKKGLQITRSLLLLATTAFNFLALRFLQLDQTATILFLSPLVVAGLAGPFLNEWVGWRRFVAICIGFSGVILITRPGFGGIHWAVIFSFLSTFGYALYSLLTRYLARFDTASTTAVFTPIAGSVVFAPPAMMSWQSPETFGTALLLFLTGILGGLGHSLLILAHERAPAPVLAPFGYINIVFMITLGYLVFGDLPGWWTLSGTAVIVSSGIYLLLRERKAAGPDGPASSATVVEG
jgi:drug/metabolite transporter (DMT)-like permease